jgi:hypothetical protein
MPGHEGIVGNKTEEQVARMGSDQPFIEPEPACCISFGVTEKAISELDEQKSHTKKHWESISVLKFFKL